MPGEIIQPFDRLDIAEDSLREYRERHANPVNGQPKTSDDRNLLVALENLIAELRDLRDGPAK